MTKLLAAPERDSDSSSNSKRSYRRDKGASAPIPDAEEIMKMLLQLNAAVVLGAISTTKANLIHRNLRTILDVQTKLDSRADTGTNPESLLEACRKNPQLLNVLEPFLSDAQLDWLMDQISDDDDGSEDKSESA